MADENIGANSPTPSDWPAAHLALPLTLAVPEFPPTADDPAVKSLRRHERKEPAATKPFHAGQARIGWTDAALAIDFTFAGVGACNRATRLNERTYLLGDVGEIFLQWPADDRYIEIHVTPENQRLQLAWNRHALDAVRRQRATLEEYAVADPTWVQSSAKITAESWSARVLIPPATLNLALTRFTSGMELRVSICRYDYSEGEPPVLSSTADYRGGRFHDRAAWHRLVLAP